MQFGISRGVVAALLAVVGGAASADTFVVTYENPGVQAANQAALCAGAANCVVGIETFDGRTFSGNSGGAAFSTNFGTNGTITGSYAGTFGIQNPSDLGPAGGSGHFITTFSPTGYTITLAHTADIPGINYFGFWLAALDAGNELQVLRNGVVVGTYTPADLVARVATNPGYLGIPNNGGDSRGPFAFVNFYDTDGFFDAIRIFESPQVGGYESDSHTVAYRSISTTPGNAVNNAVPEPESVALMATGVLGLAVARRRAKR